MSKSITQLCDELAGAELSPQNMRDVVADCFGRFIDLHQDARDPLQSMMNWVEQLRGERSILVDQYNITSTAPRRGIDWIELSQRIAERILNGEHVDRDDMSRLAREFMIQTRPDDKLKAMLYKIYRQHSGTHATLLSHDCAVLFEYFESIGVWNDELYSAAMDHYE